MGPAVPEGGGAASELLCFLALISAAASWFTACCDARWKGTAACLALLVSLRGGGGQVRPSRLPAGGGCEVVGMVILHGSPTLPVLLAVMVPRRPKVSSDHEIIL